MTRAGAAATSPQPTCFPARRQRHGHFPQPLLITGDSASAASNPTFLAAALIPTRRCLIARRICLAHSGANHRPKGHPGRWQPWPRAVSERRVRLAPFWLRPTTPQTRPSPAGPRTPRRMVLRGRRHPGPAPHGPRSTTPGNRRCWRGHTNPRPPRLLPSASSNCSAVTPKRANGRGAQGKPNVH